MKIGVFPTIAGRQGGGVETYELNLVRSLTAMNQDQLHVYCLSEQAAEAFDVNHPNVTFEILKPSSRLLSIPFSLPPAIRRSGVDLVHATFVPPLRCAVPLIVTVFDLCVRTNPELYPAAIRWRLNQLVYKRLHRFDHILCATDTTKQLIMEHFGVNEERISVSPLAVDAGFRPVDQQAQKEILSSYQINDPYLLFAGNLRVGNKNLIRLLEAYHLFQRTNGTDAKLVLTGRRSWRSRTLDDAIEKLGLRSSIIETGWMPPEHLPALYSGAMMLLFPTLCEGFGLPALESMACGTPVLTSNLSCLPEVTGDAAYLIDPYNVPEIADGMSELYRDATLRDDFRTRGFQWVKQFTWERTFRETRETYNRIL